MNAVNHRLRAERCLETMPMTLTIFRFF